MSQSPPYAASRTVWSGRQPFQGLLLAIGLSVAGVPGSAMLGFIGLLFAITQIGASFLIVIWGGAAWWLFGHKHQACAWFIVVWGRLFVSSINNLIKPWLIGFSVQMRLSLTILGVFGGLCLVRFSWPVYRPDAARRLFHFTTDMASRRSVRHLSNRSGLRS